MIVSKYLISINIFLFSDILFLNAFIVFLTVYNELVILFVLMQERSCYAENDFCVR